jgi:hypothetical protein
MARSGFVPSSRLGGSDELSRDPSGRCQRAGFDPAADLGGVAPPAGLQKCLPYPLTDLCHALPRREAVIQSFKFQWQP